MKGARSPSYLSGEAQSGDGRPGASDCHRERLALASRLSATLAPLRDPKEIAEATVEELHRSFGYFLAEIYRIYDDGMLRLLAVRGRMLEESSDPTRWEKSVHEGVNGRVARTGEPALVPDTSEDPDFVAPDTPTRSRSELALPIRVGGRIWGVLNLESVEPSAFDADDLLLTDTVAAQVGSAVRVSELFGRVESTFMATLAVLCDALEAKDPSTAAHARSVADLSEAVAARLGVRGEDLRSLRYAALLHDVGKIGVGEEILSKPGPLTDEEFAEIMDHTLIGARMLERIPDFEPVVELVRSAHERWDGNGYPDGLTGAEIPLGARVICACDAFHAMVSDRPYRPARSLEEARAELRRAGSQFDPGVVDALLAELER
jgi:putative nucleotidyltransferase with HDIG domain